MAYFENGAASEILDRQCSLCPLGEKACPVYMAQSMFNFDQMEEGKEALRACLLLLVDDNGTCQVKHLMQSACQEVTQRVNFLNRYLYIMKHINKRTVGN